MSKLRFKKFWDGFNKLNPDVFFIQEFSALLLEEIKKSNQYFAVDPRDAKKQLLQILSIDIIVYIIRRSAI